MTVPRLVAEPAPLDHDCDLREVVLPEFEADGVLYLHVRIRECSCGYREITPHTLRLLAQLRREAEERAQAPVPPPSERWRE